MLLNSIAVILRLTTYALTIIYTVKAKLYGLIGNILIALSIASYFLFGYLTINSQINPYIISISGTCFFYALGGEIVQSISDAEGDRLRKVKSIPLIYGPKVAAIIISICYALMAFMGAHTALLFGFINRIYTFILKYMYFIA